LCDRNKKDIFLEDVDGTLVQKYTHSKGTVVVKNDLQVDALYISASFDLLPYFRKNLNVLANAVLSDREIFLPICKQVKEFSNEPIPHKNKILNYLKSFKVAWFTSQRVLDEITNCYVKISDHLYNDKKYEWSGTEIYHFEKYNLVLNEDFVKHVLEQSTEPKKE